MTYYGISRLYTYNNYSTSPIREMSCGHAAIATLYDFHNKNPFGLHKIPVRYGRHPQSNDGRPHFDNDTLVGNVYNNYPPVEIFGVQFTVRENIMSALENVGINYSEGYAAFGGGGEEQKEDLRSHIAAHKRPVLVLVDMYTFSEWQVPGLSHGKEWYRLHWGFVMGYTDTHIYLACWHDVYEVPWDAFMDAWHCKGLPYPNNYYALFT